jgi:hypothetical protein
VRYIFENVSLKSCSRFFSANISLLHYTLTVHFYKFMQLYLFLDVTTSNRAQSTALNTCPFTFRAKEFISSVAFSVCPLHCPLFDSVAYALSLPSRCEPHRGQRRGWRSTNSGEPSLNNFKSVLIIACRINGQHRKLVFRENLGKDEDHRSFSKKFAAPRGIR